MITIFHGRGRSGRWLARVAAALAVLVLSGCSGTEPDQNSGSDKTGKESQKKNAFFDKKSATVKTVETKLRLTDITSKTGIQFTYRNGSEANQFTMLETLGGGVALIDFDADGDLDLFFTGGGQLDKPPAVTGLPPALYRNDGNLQFTDVTQQAGVDAAAFYSHGAFAFDYDNDGFPDLVISGFGGLLMYHNLGDGTFRDVTAEAGLAQSSWTVGVAWGDVNGDSFLDMYVSRYLNWSFQNNPSCAGREQSLVPTGTSRRDTCSPRLFKPLSDSLYLSNGDGTFRDASKESKIDQAGRGLGVLMGDLDVDGDLDVYVCNDTDANFVWQNNGRGVFKELGFLSGACHDDGGNADGSMGVDVGDFNLDGQPDIWVTNFQGERFALYEGQGECRFVHVSGSRGMLTFPDVYVGWGTVFFDADSDGDEDLFVSNGHVQRYPIDTTIPQHPLLLENARGERFASVGPAMDSNYMSVKHEGRGVAHGDLDNDGDEDLVVSHVNQPSAVLQNDTANDNRWIQLKLIGTQSSRDPIGATVEIQTAQRRQTRFMTSGSSFASTHDPRVHVGLAEAKSAKAVRVRWPSGRKETFADLAGNQLHYLIEGSGKSDE